MVVKSGPAEILLASQRDGNFLIKFHELFTDILQEVLGVRTWIKFRDVFKVLSNVLYYSLTTLSNSQTLGEEYAGIFQIHSSGKYLQKKPIQLIMILLNSCGEKIFTNSLKKFERHITSLPADHSLKPEAREKLVNLSVNLRNSLPFLQRLHTAIFYWNGEYYKFGNRVTSTGYALIRHWLKDETTRPTFRILGTVSFVHLIINLIEIGIKRKSSQNVDRTISNRNNSVTSQITCPLCLNPYQHVSAIPCGHLFCWDCIISWLQERPQCPLCRRTARPSRVVYIQSYQKS